jgi:nitrate/nitrite-specific signal transduction histidine kinase
MESKQLLIAISDNGKGLTNGPKDNNEHISRATQIIRDRLYLLNSKLKTRAAFTVANAEPGKGVMVKINLPVLYVKNIPKES